jgi:acyl-coenzyme A synthetase/AMP-(fatty) acid ligase
VSIPAFSLASFHVYMQLGLGLACGDIDSSVPSCPLSPCATSSAPALTATVHTNPTTVHTIPGYQRYMSSADPAWAYGLYYNLIGPLLIGIPMTYLHGPFSTKRLVNALHKHSITHYASSPSAYRAIRADDVNGSLGVSDEQWAAIAQTLQCASSAGEPLNTEIIEWWQSRMQGKVVADHYGQSEAGMMVNWHWAHAPGRNAAGNSQDSM